MKLNSLTIITASFNSEQTIQATLESVLNQNHRPLEYIIIDGKSTDSTCDIIQANEAKFAKKGISFNWQSEVDNGIYNAWNKGVKKSTGEWIAFLGSDDLYYKDSLLKYNEAINRFESADFITAKARIIKNGKLQRNFGEPWKWKIFRKEMKILHAGGFMRREYFQKYGLFDESFKITGDYEMLLRKKEKLEVGFIDCFLVEMNAGGVSNSFVKEAFIEATRAKVNTANRNRYIAMAERFIVLSKIYVKTIFAK